MPPLLEAVPSSSDSANAFIALMERIDRRSYHTFEFNGQRLLFDRSTGTTLEVSDLAFEVLHGHQLLPVAELACKLTKDYEGIDLREFVEPITSLKRRGFFRFKNVNLEEQTEALEGLWRHPPRRIQLLMAQSCNLGCRYCYAWRNDSNSKGTLMPWNVARQSVDYLVWRSGSRPDLQVTFFGGEPLLNYPVLRQVVEYGRSIERLGRKKFLFELITNGTLLTKDIVDFLVKERFLLFISIDGWREMHNYQRPSLDKHDCYDTIVANARYANEQYKLHGLQPPKVRANLTNKFHDAAAVGKYLESLGFTTIGVGAIEPLSHGDPSPSALTEDQADEMSLTADTTMAECLEQISRGERLGPYLGTQFNKTIQKLEPRATLGITCGIGRNTVVVDNKGNLFPCHRYEGMDAFLIGNVFSGLDREKTMDYYKKVNGHATENCHDCWIRDYCGGGCAWLLSTINGHIADPTERECNRRRHSVERTIWLRSQLLMRFPDRFKEDVAAVDNFRWELAVERKKRVSLKVLDAAPSQPKHCQC